MTAPILRRSSCWPSLYDSGHGAPLDPLRVCALYHRATWDEKTPFGREALRLMLAMTRARGDGRFADCQALAYFGFDHRFEPATFDLGPEHTITWNLDGPTITYEGRTKRISMRVSAAAAYGSEDRPWSSFADAGQPRRGL